MGLPEQAIGQEAASGLVHQKELIEHLSTEIDTHTKMIFDWRARAAFYWLVGPFVVIGSIVVVTKQVPTLHSLDNVGIAAAIIVCACFIGIAYLGARMEAHMWDQCNTWRNTIFRLASEKTPALEKAEVVVAKQRVKTAYMIAHLLLLLAFVSSMVLIWHSGLSNTSGAPSPQAGPSPSVSGSPIGGR